MSAVCRLTTVAALLMHLFFGCSLHHAAACGHHDHDGRQHACSAVVATSIDDSATVRDDHVCDHDHDHGCSGEQETAASIDKVVESTPACCARESQPCDGNHPGCHGVVECSFVPSSDIVFSVDRPLVALLSYQRDPMMNVACSLSTSRLHPRSVRLATNSLSHCASLCTWII